MPERREPSGDDERPNSEFSFLVQEISYSDQLCFIGAAELLEGHGKENKQAARVSEAKSILEDHMAKEPKSSSSKHARWEEQRAEIEDMVNRIAM